jgi:hypothetical protein
VDKIPEDRDPRLAFLEGWAKGQLSQLTEEERRRWAEEQKRQAERIAREEARCAEQIPHVLAQARKRTGQADSPRDMAAMPVVITKPSDLPVDRAAVFADLMVRLREYEWADPIVSACDEPIYIAPNATDLARRHHPSAPWLLYMEDDVILGPDFGLLPGLLREANELFPDTGLVSFFSVGPAEPGWLIHPMEHFAWTQCFAIRNTDYLVGFRAFIDHVVPQSANKQLWENSDVAVGTFLAVEYDAYALWCPSLVQHAYVTSVLRGGPPPFRRMSWSYTQAYG